MKNKSIFFAIAVLSLTNCSFAGPYVTSIAPAGEQGLLVEKCKAQLNPFTNNISTGDCNTSYVYIGDSASRKNSCALDGTNPNNNVITIK